MTQIWFIAAAVLLLAELLVPTFFILPFAICSFFAGIVAPYNPFDPASVSLMDAFIPPIWSDGGNVSFLLGTDQQGRDMFSTMIYGSRTVSYTHLTLPTKA